MELFLDSVDFEEIEQALELGILTGLTTTPTFMYRHGISDVDKALVSMSEKVECLHVEAVGGTREEILGEVERIKVLSLRNPPVFKIPISNHGLDACRVLVKNGDRVNMHLIYTLNQAYLAMEAGAYYVCPLVGRLHDQGHDAFALVKQMVGLVKRYDYKSKIMVSSVRHTEHVRQALLLGAHACTVPWSIMRTLCRNSLTTLGAEQFQEHTRLMSVKVRDIIREKNPICGPEETVFDAIVQMTESRLGAVSIVDKNKKLVGIFTDGDLRRSLKIHGRDLLSKPMSEFSLELPLTIRAEALLHEAVELFRCHEFDNIIVIENDKPLGMLDIQDFVKMNLLG
jgi:transaldolase